jgi:hypothetical protein
MGESDESDESDESEQAEEPEAAAEEEGEEWADEELKGSPEPEDADSATFFDLFEHTVWKLEGLLDPLRERPLLVGHSEALGSRDAAMPHPKRSWWTRWCGPSFQCS